MKQKSNFAGRIIIVAVGFFLIAGAAEAQRRAAKPAPPVKMQRFSLSMNGGFGMVEGHRGLLDMKAELQYGLSRNIRLGLGLGYLSETEGWRGDHGRNDGRPGLDQMMGRNGLDRDFNVIPVTLNAYYVLPAGRKWNLFMSAGGSYNFASLRGPAEAQHRRAWGGQAGLGVEYRLSPKIQITAEGGYRFARFHGFAAPRVNPTLRLDDLNADAGPFENMIRRGMAVLLNDLFAPETPRRYNVNLNGFTCRLGVKFGI
jgi:hypothetical protein